MRIERVDFEEVFDVEEGRGDFSFRSAGRAHYGVRLQHHVIPREGSRFAIAFAEPGNWSSVLGWRDLASTNVTLRHPAGSFWISELSDIILYGPFFIGGALLLGGPWMALVTAAVVTCAAFYRILRVRRLNLAIKNALLEAC